MMSASTSLDPHSSGASWDPPTYLLQNTIVLASRPSGHHLNTLTLKDHPSEHPKSFIRNLQNVNFKHIMALHMDMDSMHYFY